MAFPGSPLPTFQVSANIPPDMSHQNLTATLRVITGRRTNKLRAVGQVPGVMFGFGTEPVSLTVDHNTAMKAYNAAGESTVLDLTIDGTVHPVLISDIQRHPLTDDLSHIDFRRVDLTRKIEAKIALKLIGEAPAVKAHGGTLIQSLEEVEVISLPNALVHEIEVDVSGLVSFEDVIRVSDITAPAGIEIRTESTMAIASVQPPRSEAEMASLNEAVDADISKVEVLTEKKEEAEPAKKA